MYRVFKNYIQTQFDPPGRKIQPGIEFFRHRLLVCLLFCLAMFCTIAYIPSVYYGYVYRFDSIIFIDTLTVGGVYFLLLRKNMDFFPRALGLLAGFYVLGVWLLIILGPTGAGFMWLLLFSIMAGVLLGFGPALASLGLNILTVAGLSLLVFNKSITWTLLPEDEIAIWAVKSVNFICINAIVSVSTGFIIARIGQIAKEETRRRIRLDQEIQARVLTEEENRALTERLHQARKMEAMGTLAGGIAHDFNNILGAIMGHAELLLMESGLSGPVRTSLEKICLAGERAKGITRQILTFGRQQQSAKNPNDLGEITRECVDLIRIGVPSEVELNVNIPPGPFPVLGDKNQIFQVIMNLLTNGIQAMEGVPAAREKSLSLSLASLSPSLLEDRSGLDRNKPHFILKVADTGTGISQEHMNRIFDPYFTTKKSGKGTGLGLSITHGIVKDHGGEIQVDSTPGKGTCFTIVLPAHNQVSSLDMGEESNTFKGQERILIIDDDAEVREVHTRFLERFGYRVTAMSTPEDALHFVLQHPDAVDLAILDWKMPGMTGDELGIRIHDRFPDLPLILCSGFPGEQGENSDFHEVLAKPVNAWQLAQAVRRVLDESRNVYLRSNPK